MVFQLCKLRMISMAELASRGCTFEGTLQARCLSIVDFVDKFGVINTQNINALHHRILAVLEAKYQLNDTESEDVLLLVKKSIQHDFSHLDTDIDTIIYVILGHDIENINMLHFNEYNWLHKAMFSFME